MNPNYYLATAIAFLYGNRPNWRANCAVGKTVVSCGLL
jgi:phosphoglucomutase